MQQYEDDLSGSPAEEYLANRRGLNLQEISHLHLGYVGEPLLGHEMYRGMLAIPYIRSTDDKKGVVVSIRYRCIEEKCGAWQDEEKENHNGHGKYNTESGDRPRLYNTVALLQPVDNVAITEGELDTVTAQLCGIESVGVPGATSWQPHFREPFLGYETVWVLADGDDAGMRFARVVAESLPNARIVPMPEGDDVNSLYVRDGVNALRERIGIDDDA